MLVYDSLNMTRDEEPTTGRENMKATMSVLGLIFGSAHAHGFRLFRYTCLLKFERCISTPIEWLNWIILYVRLYANIIDVDKYAKWSTLYSYGSWKTKQLVTRGKSAHIILSNCRFLCVDTGAVVDLHINRRPTYTSIRLIQFSKWFKVNSEINLLTTQW